jgi:hypothetical protein
MVDISRFDRIDENFNVIPSPKKVIEQMTEDEITLAVNKILQDTDIAKIYRMEELWVGDFVDPLSDDFRRHVIQKTYSTISSGERQKDKESLLRLNKILGIM